MTTIKKKTAGHLVEHELALKVYLDSLLLDDTAVDHHEAVPSTVVTHEEEAICVAADTVTPGFKEETFECLMFNVAGALMLSVPLTHLNGILPWEGKVVPVPGYAEWFLGLLQNRGRQVKVIDIARFVIPRNHRARALLLQERKFKHIVLVDGGRVGLACDGLGDVLTLNKEQVRWREDRTQRPWLAGTVIDRMSALVDIEQFVTMLKNDGVPDDIS